MCCNLLREKCESERGQSVLPNTAGKAWPCHAVGRPVQEIIGDGYATLPQLWIQLHGDISFSRPGSGQHGADDLRSLPLESLVIPPGPGLTLLHGGHE